MTGLEQYQFKATLFDPPPHYVSWQAFGGAPDGARWRFPDPPIPYALVTMPRFEAVRVNSGYVALQYVPGSESFNCGWDWGTGFRFTPLVEPEPPVVYTGWIERGCEVSKEFPLQLIARKGSKSR